MTRVSDLHMEPDVVQVDFAGSADELAALYLEYFPPVVAIRAGLEGPEQQAALGHDLSEFFRKEYAAGGVRYDYLLVRATVV